MAMEIGLQVTRTRRRCSNSPEVLLSDWAPQKGLLEQEPSALQWVKAWRQERFPELQETTRSRSDRAGVPAGVPDWSQSVAC